MAESVRPHPPQSGQSLAELQPDVAAEWHPTRNGDVRPEEVVAGTHKSYWWKCPNGPDHEWQAETRHRSNGIGCPFCAGRQVSVTNSLARFPELLVQWHPTRNGGVRPEEVVAGTNKSYWWKCPEGPDHEWQASGEWRSVRGTGCPFCAGKRVSVTNCVASVPELLAQWHPTRNGDLRPEEVVAGTGKRYWWKCPEGPDHEWKTSGDARSRAGCPFCRGLAVSVTNSFAQFPELLVQWHPTRNGGVRPEDVVAGTHKSYWWKCPNGPDHEWKASGEKRTNRNSGCPFCVGQKVSITNNVLSVTEMAAQWHPTRNGNLRPETISAGTHRKFWWKCPVGPDHEWRTSAKARKAGSRCPFCSVNGGYRSGLPGTVYVLTGKEWGKVGISNVLPKRLAKHAAGGAFGPLVVAADFTNGKLPVRIEAGLCDFIAERTAERAPADIDGFTESFPIRLLDDVLTEFDRLLSELPTSSDHSIIRGA